MLYTICRSLLILLFKVCFRLRVKGIENFPSQGGCLVASNHLSFLDPVTLGVVSRRRLNFLARDDLFRNKLFGWLLSRVGAIPLKRGRIDPEALKESLRRLGKGEALLLFPEGTRSRNGSLGKAEPGIAFLALRAGVPIVPVALSGTERALPLDARFIRPAEIKVTFGREILPSEFPRAGEECDYERAAALVMTRISELK